MPFFFSYFLFFFAMDRLGENGTGPAVETHIENDTGLGGKTHTANDTGLGNRLRAGIGKNQGTGEKFLERNYLKEATVIVNVENVNEVRAEDIIKAVSKQCGQGKILALRHGKQYELTMEKIRNIWQID